MPSTTLRLTLAAVAGLSPTSSTIAQSALAPQAVLSPHTYKMDDCTNGSVTPPAGSVKQVVRVVIRPAYDPTDPQRKVKYRAPDTSEANESDADDEEKGTRNDWGGVETGNKRPFHVDLTQVPTVAPSTHVPTPYVQIRVILKAKDKLKFYRKGGIEGVGAGKEHSKEMCGAHLLLNGKFPVAAFYVPMRPGGIRPPIDPEPYNIGLVPLRDEDTPFFVDPMIKNNG